MHSIIMNINFINIILICCIKCCIIHLKQKCISMFLVSCLSLLTNVPNNADSVAKYFRTLTIVHQFSNNK